MSAAPSAESAPAKAHYSRDASSCVLAAGGTHCPPAAAAPKPGCCKRCDQARAHPRGQGKNTAAHSRHPAARRRPPLPRAPVARQNRPSRHSPLTTRLSLRCRSMTLLSCLTDALEKEDLCCQSHRRRPPVRSVLARQCRNTHRVPVKQSSLVQHAAMVHIAKAASSGDKAAGRGHPFRQQATRIRTSNLPKLLPTLGHKRLLDATTASPNLEDLQHTTGLHRDPSRSYQGPSALSPLNPKP